MNWILLSLPYLISFLNGYLLISLLFGKDRDIDLRLHFFLGGGLGLALSGHLTFYNFIFFNQLNIPFIITINFLALAI